MSDVGKRLREERDRRRLTQVEVFTKTGINNKTLSGYENGVSHPDLESLKVLANLYGVTTDYLLGIDDRHPADKLIEYMDVLELTDEEIYDRMTFKVDDMTLSKEEVLEFIGFVRYQRSKKKV